MTIFDRLHKAFEDAGFYKNGRLQLYDANGRSYYEPAYSFFRDLKEKGEIISYTFSDVNIYGTIYCASFTWFDGKEVKLAQFISE